MKSKFVVPFFMCSFILLMFVLTGCIHSTVPLTAFPATETTVISSVTMIPPTETPLAPEKYALQREYAAVWASKEEGLNVRNQAGISAMVIEVIPWDSRKIFLTGNRSLLGSSLWLEITVNGGITGWVNSWNLSEYVPPSQFCEDPRVSDLLDSFRQSFQNPQGPSIQDHISPNRGLSIRHNWYSPDVTFSVENIDSIFSDVEEIDWGIMADSGLQVIGSLSDIIQPNLEDVFFRPSEMRCNELTWGNTAGEVIWPDELKNINFYSFYRPAEEDGNAFDWRTWAVGIEFVGDQPFIAILIHYSSEL